MTIVQCHTVGISGVPMLICKSDLSSIESAIIIMLVHVLMKADLNLCNH